MSNHYNEAGEPLMDGSAMRYEMYLDSLYEPDPDDFYDRWDWDEPEECDLDHDLDLHDGYAWCWTHDRHAHKC